MLTLSISPNSVALSGNPMIHQVLCEQAAGTPYTPLTFPAAHHVEVDILIESVFGSNTYVNLGTVDMRLADATYHYTIDVATTFHAWFQDYMRTLANPVGSGNTFDPSVLRRYKLVFREKNTTSTIDTLETTPKTGFFGVDELDAVFPPETNSTVWLTAMPQKRFVNLSRPLYVSFYNNTGDSFEFSPKFQLYGRDGILLTTVQGTGVSIPLPFDEVTLADGEVVTFQIGNLDFGTDYPLSMIAKMTFQPLANGSTIFAVPLVFYNDFYEYENEKILLYRNRKGCIESFQFNGEFSKNLEVVRYESVSTGDYSKIQEYYGHRRQYDADVTTVYTFRTGYIKKNEKEALSEMFLTNEIWWLSNGKYIPLRLLDNKFEEFDSFEDLTSWVVRAAPKNIEK